MKKMRIATVFFGSQSLKGREGMFGRTHKAITGLATRLLLVTESAEELDAFNDAVVNEIGTTDCIEAIYVDNYIAIEWQIRRYRQAQSGIIRRELPAAMESLLFQCLQEPGKFSARLREEAKAIALGWFTDEETRKRAQQILRRLKMDEVDVEAEAIRRCISDLEVIDTMLASLERRRDNCLWTLEAYRKGLGRKLRAVSDRLVEQQDACAVTPAIERSVQGAGAPIVSEPDAPPAKRSSGPWYERE